MQQPPTPYYFRHPRAAQSGLVSNGGDTDGPASLCVVMWATFHGTFVPLLGLIIQEGSVKANPEKICPLVA